MNTFVHLYYTPLQVSQESILAIVYYREHHDTVDIRLAIGKIVRYKNQISIHVKHKVKASMKDVIYRVEVLFNQYHLIACSCTCKASARGVQRIMCVHILPVISVDVADV